jgi:hypothetical protein
MEIIPKRNDDSASTEQEDDVIDAIEIGASENPVPCLFPSAANTGAGLQWMHDISELLKWNQGFGSRLRNQKPSLRER